MSYHKDESITKQLKNYAVGFMLSLAITLIMFWIVLAHIYDASFSFSTAVIIPMLGILAFSQFVVQLVYFLHLGTETRPRWKLIVFWFMIIVVLIVVVGSLWIMYNLNYNMMMPPENMDIKTQKGF